VVAGRLKALERVQREPALRAGLWDNTVYFRERVACHGFTVTPGEHPILPLMIGDAALAHRMAAAPWRRGLRGGVLLPGDPEGKARIWVHISAARAREDLDCALRTFGAMRAEQVR
jgi:glycine C-acetyltransferase